jgi:hypothetical protein
MRRHRLLIVVALVLLDWRLASQAGAADLAPLSSADLLKRCLHYIESPASAEGRSCGAYVRGFIEGSPKVVLLTEETNRRQRESFSERALRTRLGTLTIPDPDYCLNSKVSLREFITQMLGHAEVNPPEEHVSASALLYGTLSQFYRCSA